jgi:hypothetical protein
VGEADCAETVDDGVEADARKEKGADAVSGEGADKTRHA